MRLLIIPIQTISDAITNSSSELFILNTNKSCQEIKDILNTFTSGFKDPEVFHLEEFRKWRKKFRNGEIKETFDYPGSIFEIVNGWFKDSEDKKDLMDLRIQFLLDPCYTIYEANLSIGIYDSSYQEPIHKQFINYINNNWKRIGKVINNNLKDAGENSIYHVTWWDIQHHYLVRTSLEEFAEEFINNYTGPKPSVWEIPEKDDLSKFDGCVMVVSEDDNSIPYETWDQINDTFNGRNIHLG